MNQGPDTASAEAAKEKLGEQAEAAASAKSGEPAAPDASAAANRETGLALPDEDAPSNAEVLAALRQSEALQMQWFQAIHQQVNSVFPWLQSIGGQVGGVQQSVSLLQSEIKARPALPPQPVAAPLAPPVPVPAKPAPSESASGFSLEGIAANIGQAIQNVTGSSDSGPRAAAKASDDGAWEAVFFGRDLSTAPQLAAQRQELLRDLRSGQPEAQALVGLLLLFRGSAAEKMPVLLKDMGEAWYRWRPGSAHGEDPIHREHTPL